MTPGGEAAPSPGNESAGGYELPWGLILAALLLGVLFLSRKE
jgi:hypothetical protein